MKKDIKQDGDDLFIELTKEDLETIGASEGDDLIWELNDDESISLRKMKKLLLVDHHALLHRCRNALLKTGRKYTTSEGIPTTGVFSYLNALLSIIEKTECTHVVVCFDAGGNARKKESETYKANRGTLDPDFLSENRILLNEALYALGIESIGIRGYEADDLLYTLSHVAQFGTDRFDQVVIATVDQDILQCVTEKTSVLLWNSAKKQQLMDPAAVIEKWGVEPDDIRFIKALSGDSSDNIKGIKGVGPKTAVKIFKESLGNVENIITHAKVAKHKEQFLENLNLVTLRNVIGEVGPIDWSNYVIGLGMRKDWEWFLSTYELNALAKRVGKTVELMKMRG